MGREHRIPLVRIRCMTDKCIRRLKELWRGLGGKPPRPKISGKPLKTEATGKP
jgi:hypothetical protein